MPKNYYMILGISTDAQPGEVKSAYRRLAKEFHPDHFGDESAPFLAIQEAYSVLGDPVLRRNYDVSSMQAHERRKPRHAEPIRTRTKDEIEPLIPESKHTDLGSPSLLRSFETYSPGIDDIFDRIWGNFWSRRQTQG